MEYQTWKPLGAELWPITFRQDVIFDWFVNGDNRGLLPGLMEVASFKASIDDFSESENIFIREEFKYCVSDLIETGSFLFRKFRDKFFDGT